MPFSEHGILTIREHKVFKERLHLPPFLLLLLCLSIHARITELMMSQLFSRIEAVEGGSQQKEARHIA